MGSGLPREAALWKWLEEQQALPSDPHHIWMMHYALFTEDLHEPNYDITKSDQYLAWYFGIDEPHRSRIMEVFRDTCTDRVITGHIHCRKEFMSDGIAFDLAPATSFSQWKKRWPDGDPTLGFFRYDVTGNTIHKTFIPLTYVSHRKGYGPGGHPTPEQRDYSIAWVR